MRNGQRFDAGVAVAVHPRPQLFRIERIEAAERHLRHRAAAVDHVAVQVLVLGAAGELVADEGGEDARLVVALGGVDGLAPGRAKHIGIGRHVALTEGVRAYLALGLSPGRPRQRPGRDSVHELGGRVARGRLRWIDHRRQHAQEAGVVGDRVEIQRRIELDLEAGRMGQRLALRVAVGVVGRGPGAVEEGVVREVGVRVEVAEVGIAQGVGTRRGGSGVAAWRRVVSDRVAVTAAARSARRRAGRRAPRRQCGRRMTDAAGRQL